VADLVSLLTNAGKSLSGATGAVQTVSHNLQNVNTPGYSRQRAVLRATLPADKSNGVFIGRGSELSAVAQTRDRFLEYQIPKMFGDEQRALTKSDSLQAVHTFDPEQPGGVGNAVARFFDSIRTLNQNPSEKVLRDDVVQASRQLAYSFQNASAEIEGARTGIDKKMTGLVDEVNILSAQVAQLNKQIRLARSGGRAEPNDLLDARRGAHDRLSELVGAKPVSDEQGNVSLHLPTGGAFVSGDFASKFVLTPDAGDHDHPALQVTGTSGTRMNVRPGSISGALGGLMSARDETLLAAAQQLDQLAYDFAGSINLVHRSGTDLMGQNGVDLFQVPFEAKGAARAFTLDPSVEADSRLLATKSSGMAGSGDSGITQQLLGLESAKLPGGANPTTSYAAIVAKFGADSRTAKDAADHTKTMRTNIEAMRDSVSGVSVDEELVDMSKAQRAYEAISKVLTTADGMLDTLLKLR